MVTTAAARTFACPTTSRSLASARLDRGLNQTGWYQQ